MRIIANPAIHIVKCENLFALLKGLFLKTKENDDPQACKLHLYKKVKNYIATGLSWTEGSPEESCWGAAKLQTVTHRCKAYKERGL